MNFSCGNFAMTPLSSRYILSIYGIFFKINRESKMSEMNENWTGTHVLKHINKERKKKLF